MGKKSKYFYFMNNDIQLKPTKSMNAKLEKLEKMHFSLFFTARAYFCPSCIRKKEKLKEKIFLEIDNYLNRRLDVNFYLKNSVKFDKLKEINLNHHQNLSFEFIEKESIFSFIYGNRDKCNSDSPNELKPKFQDDLKRNEIVKYFKGKILGQEMDKIDKFLIEIIDHKLKEKIKN